MPKFGTSNPPFVGRVVMLVGSDQLDLVGGWRKFQQKNGELLVPKKKPSQVHRMDPSLTCQARRMDPSCCHPFWAPSWAWDVAAWHASVDAVDAVDAERRGTKRWNGKPCGSNHVQSKWTCCALTDPVLFVEAACGSGINYCIRLHFEWLHGHDLSTGEGGCEAGMDFFRPLWWVAYSVTPNGYWILLDSWWCFLTLPWDESDPCGDLTKLREGTGCTSGCTTLYWYHREDAISSSNLICFFFSPRNSLLKIKNMRAKQVGIPSPPKK